MRLVDHEQPHAHLAHAVEEARGREALGRHVEQPQLAGGRAPEHLRVGARVLLRVHERHPVAEPARGERLDLVLHQRDERRDDHRQVVAQQRRKLIAERLARAGGHDDQHVAVGQRGLARLALARPEAREAEVLVQGGGQVHGGKAHTSAVAGGTGRPVAESLRRYRAVYARRAPRARTCRSPTSVRSSG